MNKLNIPLEYWPSHMAGRLSEVLASVKMDDCLRRTVPEWPCLKIKQGGGGYAGFGPCFHLPGQAILGHRFVEPQPIFEARPVASH